MKFHNGRRLCQRCLEELLPGSCGWTWGFGTCLCGHFGITVDAEGPEVQKAAQDQRAKQADFGFD